MKQPAPHGTYARYQRPRPGCRCDDCKRACRDYQRAYRAANREYVEEQGALSQARGRALTRLAKLYPADFRALYRDEVNKAQS